jgi:hypothetical protein
MARFSSQEATALKNKGIIDYYPNIANFHKNEFISFFDQVNTDYLVERKSRLREVDSAEKASDYMKSVKKAFLECLGEMPQSTPVKSEVVGTLDKGRYFIDKVLIESLPGYYLSANFYYPKNNIRKIPGILFLCGHSSNGKASNIYVSFCVEAVLNGFCILTFDPLGQGERKMYSARDSEKFNEFDPDAVHFLLGQQTELAGDNVTRYMMWDNIRALDYLCTRKEADTERLAVTGNSGGGHMSAFMGAYDDRLKVVAPCSYITELRTLAYNVGVQESEQSMPDFMKKGLDLADLVIMAAPKPYFIGSGLFDFFTIDGVRDAFIDARKIYRLLDRDNLLEVYTTSKPHGLWYDMREMNLRFLCKHLGVEYIEDKGIDYENLPQEEELYCVKDGDINLYNKTSLQEINLARVENIYPAEPNLGSRDEFKAYSMAIKNNAEKVLRIDRSIITADIEKAEKSFDTGRNASVTQITYYSEKYMKIYACLYEKAGQPLSRILIHVGPLDADSSLIDKYLEEFSSVLVVETRGTGRETMDEASIFHMLPPYGSYVCNADMLGRSIQGMRVQDVMSAIKLLKSNDTYRDAQISISAEGDNALTALFIAVLEGIGDVRLKNLLYSYRSLIENRVHDWDYTVFIPGLLMNCDVSDLVASVLPGKVEINGLIDHMKKPADQEKVRMAFGKCLKVCSLLDCSPTLTIK